MKKIAAINFSSAIHLLDHIAPLAYILDIPLYIDDESCSNLLKTYYPEVKHELKRNLAYDFLAKNYDVLISCNYWFVEDKFAFETLNNKNIKLVFCPHGNSDKGHINKVNMLAYTMQDMVFLYGDHMKNLLKTLNVFSKLKNHTTIGNFRLSYYKKFKSFYDKLVDTTIFSKLDPNKKTILYAPTWKDAENSSSFFFVLNKLIEKVPSNYNLIIKPHPNLEEKNPVEFYKLFPTKLLPNIFWLQDFTPIYPLLNRCDIYLGDFSSIGYDFLYYQKPMFFIDPFDRDPKKDPSLFLHSCGEQIKTDNLDNIFSIIENNQNSNFQEKQKKLYDFTFDKYLEIPKIKENILKSI
ncbi:MAG: hypothetical protein KR126chlam6_00666 [Candidatus Anoxychlamydiales bacterium]|nr:hypothetical protein [Candidatus Anoxychlamydiales bacterium]